MSITTIRVIENLLLPPALSIILVFTALALLLFRRLSGAKWFLILGIGHLYFLSIPQTAAWLSSFLEPDPISISEFNSDQADAIVLLSGPDRYSTPPEYEHDHPGPMEMERIRHAAVLHRATKLPIAVVGGDSANTGIAGGFLLQKTLSDHFMINTKWTISKSSHTFDNAYYTARTLHPYGMSQIVLVTHAWHMKRAKAAFEREGFSVIPAATGFYSKDHLERGGLAWIPNARALNQIRWVIHELIGISVASLWHPS